jgi:RNA polymerase sigma-70 factor (ECF subfamily)
LQTDAELVNAVLNGEKELFAELVRRYEKPVRAVALNILHDSHLATDVSQDSFVTAYEKLPSLHKPESFGYWLMKIVRRCAIESARQKAAELSPERDLVSKIEKPNGHLDDEKRHLLSTVLKLPDVERQVVMLHYFGQNSVSDVAKIAGRSVGTVTKQLSRARIRLRRILERPEK